MSISTQTLEKNSSFINNEYMAFQTKHMNAMQHYYQTVLNHKLPSNRTERNKA